jgi:hypothetical protein
LRGGSDLTPIAVSTFSVIGDSIKGLLRTILDGEFTTHLTGQAKIDDEENFKKMKAVYQTCMNEDAIKAYGTKYVTEKLKEFEKIFPEQGPSLSSSSNEELTNILIWLGKNFATGLVSIDVDVSIETRLTAIQSLTLVGRETTKHRQSTFSRSEALVPSYPNSIGRNQLWWQTTRGHWST